MNESKTPQKDDLIFDLVRVLLVEGDPIQAWWVQEELQLAGFCVTYARSFKEARRHCGKELYDLCILNYRYRDSDSALFISQVFAEHLLPSLLLTGERLNNITINLPWSVLNVLPKPYSRRQLVSTVRNCLNVAEMVA